MKLLFVLIFALTLITPEPETVDMTVTVTNINTLKGTIELGLFNDAESFLEKGKEYKNYSKIVKKNTVVFTLNDIPKGDYGIAIYHDVNSDKKCNLNFLGIPVEPYGFSKNFRPKISKPSFKDCKVTASKDTKITIELID